MTDKDALRRELKSKGYFAGTDHALKLSQQENKPYYTKVNGAAFVVYPNVFSPEYFDEPEFLAGCLMTLIRSGEAVLEIGTGTGILAITIAKHGAGRVVAVDINEDAVKNALENVRTHGLENKVEVRKGDVYSTIDNKERFDLIVWNAPWGYVEQDVSMLERSVHDPFYSSIQRYILESPRYTRPGGRVLLSLSVEVARVDLIETWTQQIGKKLTLVAQRTATESNPISIQLYEIS